MHGKYSTTDAYVCKLSLLFSYYEGVVSSRVLGSGVLGVSGVFGVFGVLGVHGVFGVLGDLGVFGVLRDLGVFDFSGRLGLEDFLGVLGLSFVFCLLQGGISTSL